MHTYLVRIYNETNDLQDSYTLEATNEEEANSQIKSQLQNRDQENYRSELEDLTVKASAGATKPGDPVETAPMDEVDEPEDTPDEKEVVEPIPTNDTEKEGTQAPDASDDFSDQAKLITDANINPPIKKANQAEPLSPKRQKEANRVKRELLEPKTK